MKCSLVCSALASPAAGLFRALGGGTPLLGVMGCPVCGMGEQWLCEVLCFVNELLRERADHLLNLLLIIDIFITAVSRMAVVG